MKSRAFPDRSRQTGIFAGLFLMLLILLSFPARADAVNLEVTYGYQNTAKAGHYLPLTIHLENTQEETFSGYVYVYMAASGKNLYEYRYQTIVEAGSESELKVTVSLGSRVNQLLVTAVRRDGSVLGSRRIGLEADQSEAELLIGLLSEKPERLSYLNDVALNDGLLHTRTVTLDRAHLPEDETELDQLDVLLITDFDMSTVEESEARSIRKWTEDGGVLIFGGGQKGAASLTPYFTDLLKQPLVPTRALVRVSSLLGSQEESGQRVSLALAPVYLESGRELFSMDELPLLSEVSAGAGLVAAAAYDFCDLQRFATDHEEYAAALLGTILGENRLDALSVSATEQSLVQYESIERLMNLSDVTKLPNVVIYMLLLFVYVLLVGPLLHYYLRCHSALRLYRPAILMLSVFFTLAVWVCGIGTRFGGTFLTYAKLKDVSAESVDETDYINVRSPYQAAYGLDIKTEYYVYPVQRGEGFTGDLGRLAESSQAARTCIYYGRGATSIEIRNEQPFTAKYFELHNKMPNSEGSFSGELVLNGDVLSGSITNNTSETLTDAAVLLYGKLCRIGRLEAGATAELSGLELLNVPVGQSSWIASLCTNGSGQNFLRYYLENNLTGCFSDARLIGFVREDTANFIAGKSVESYGVTMVTAALPLSEGDGRSRCYSALSRDPEVLSGDYEQNSNSISDDFPTVLRYHLGDNAEILELWAETEAELDDSESSSLSRFRGSICFYNNQSGGYDTVELGEEMDAVFLAPYLDESNVLQVRYTPRDSDGKRQYLPMLRVRCREQAVKPVYTAEAESGAEDAAAPEEASERSGEVQP